MFHTDAPYMISNIALGTLSLSVAAHFSRALRPILYPAAASIALIAVSTGVLGEYGMSDRTCMPQALEGAILIASHPAVMPTQKKLDAYADKLRASSSADLTIAQQSEIDDLLVAWRSANFVRIGLAAVSFTLSLGAVLLI